MEDKIKQLFGVALPHTNLNRSLRILIVVNSTFVFIMGLFAPFYAVFIQKIGGTIAFAGLSWALFSIVAGVLIFLFSNLEIRVKRQALLMATGYLIRAGVFLSYAFMTNIAQLLITQVLWGVGAALGTPSFDAVYSAHTSQDSSIVQWGGWEGISAIATGLAALVGGAVIQAFGYPTVFLAMAIISAGLAIYIWRLPPEVL